MYQNLVVSPLFLKSLTTIDPEKGNLINYFLSTEVFLCDKDKKLFEEYDSISQQYADSPQTNLLLKNFITNVTSPGKAKLLTNVNFNRRKSIELLSLSIEKRLAMFDDWKIILVDDAKKVIHDEFERELGIELSDCNNYLNPSEKSRIRVFQVITKNPNEEFDFGKWVFKFTRDTKTLEIQDGYACSKNEFRDIKYLIGKLKPNTRVRIITLSDKARNDSRHNNKTDDIIAEEKLNELKNQFVEKIIEWELKEEKKLLEDRHLKTDKFFINLGHSLGGTYKDKNSDKILCRRQFTITVSKAS